MEPSISNWTPQLIVELIEVVVWPILILFLGYNFRFKISEGIKHFFKNNNLSTFKASATGFEAKFSAAAKQTSETRDSSNPIKGNGLPPHVTVEDIRERHANSTTRLSQQHYDSIKLHLPKLKLSDKDIIDLLSVDLSIVQTEKSYANLNGTVFRSQFDLLNSMKQTNSYISNSDLKIYFNKIKTSFDEGYEGWDWLKYISFLVGVSLMKSDGEGYQLTLEGESYVNFLLRTPTQIQVLTKL